MDATWDRDGEHLKLLGIFNYVKAGLWAMGCLGGAVYLGMAGFFGAMLRSIPEHKDPPPEEVVQLMTWMMGTVGVVLLLASIAMCVLSAYSGHCLQNARRRILCLVVAGLHLLSFPLGTLLGIFTIIVLSRPSVIARFEGRPATPDDSPGDATERWREPHVT